jgi:hypothetical protein
VRRRALVAAVLAGLLGPAASAGAQDPGVPQGPYPDVFAQPGGLNVVSSAERIYAECMRPATGATACSARLVLEAEGRVVFDRPVDIPVDEGGTGLVTEADVSAVRDAQLRRGRKTLRATLRVLATDGRELSALSRTDRFDAHRPRASFEHCGVPLFAPLHGGPVTTIWDSEPQVLTTDVPAWMPLVNGAGETSFRHLGVTYTLSPGARLRFDCSSVNSVAGARPFPTIMLESGRVRVSGTPQGARQPATTVYTREASLGSRSRERVDYVVERDARRGIASMRVQVGRTLEATRTFSGAAFPCTRGRTIRVSRTGIVR